MPPAAPSAVLLVRSSREEELPSPELRYLRSWVELQARRAFGGVEVIDAADPLEAAGDLPARLDRHPRPGAVLLLPDGRTLIGAASMERMARVLETSDARVVVPRPLEQAWAVLPETLRGEIHTLRGFERAEEGILRAEEGGELSPAPAGARIPSGPPPVSLVSPELLRRALERAAVGEKDSPGAGLPGDGWRRSWDAVAALLREGRRGGGDPSLHAGVYHRFIDYYGEVRSDVLPHLGELRDRSDGGPRVLEVGCGRGSTGELLRRELQAEVTGVELNPVVAAEARRRLDHVVGGDVEDPATATELAERGPFDLVLALELFEHLAYPERFLQRAAGLLRPGGTIFLSTPNVGHWSVVEDLLAGRWDYLPIGLLCYTHLRFFTRRTLEDWLGRLGFEDFDLVPQTTAPSPRLEALAQSSVSRSSDAGLPAGLELDRESLRTKGFYVRIKVGTPTD